MRHPPASASEIPSARFRPMAGRSARKYPRIYPGTHSRPRSHSRRSRGHSRVAPPPASTGPSRSTALPRPGTRPSSPGRPQLNWPWSDVRWRLTKPWARKTRRWGGGSARTTASRGSCWRHRRRRPPRAVSGHPPRAPRLRVGRGGSSRPGMQSPAAPPQPLRNRRCEAARPPSARPALPHPGPTAAAPSRPPRRYPSRRTAPARRRHVPPRYPSRRRRRLTQIGVAVARGVRPGV
eukprot:scaffold11760_cov108-Isochrysis_galbana.AAC.4